MKIKFNIIKPFEPLFRGELSHYRELLFYGGRGGGKTDQITQWYIKQALTTKNSNFLIGRETEKSNIRSLILNFQSWINQLGLKGVFIDKKTELFKFQAKMLTCKATNTNLIFAGINHNLIFSLKSIPNLKYCWVEEANYLRADTYRILTPTIRAKNSQIILSFNPQNDDDFVWQELVKKRDDLRYCRKINYDENPYFPPVLELERQRDFKTLPRDLYLHIWEGEPTNYNDMQVIDTEKIGRFDDTKEHKYSRLIIVVDSAFSTKASADYSVVSVFGKFENEIHLLRLERGHWDFNTLIEMLKSLYFWAQEKTKQSVNEILIEKKASGQSLIQEIQRLTNFQIKPVIPTTDKFTRLTEIISDLDKLKLPFSDNALNYWINDFLKECKEFRADLKHAHDDQIDCVVYALKELKDNPINWNALSNKLSGVSRETFF